MKDNFPNDGSVSFEVPRAEVWRLLWQGLRALVSRDKLISFSLRTRQDQVVTLIDCRAIEREAVR